MYEIIMYLRMYTIFIFILNYQETLFKLFFTFFRLFQASETARDRALLVRAQLGGGRHVHIQREGANHRGRTA